jgi:hypothetical protein
LHHKCSPTQIYDDDDEDDDDDDDEDENDDDDDGVEKETRRNDSSKSDGHQVSLKWHEIRVDSCETYLFIVKGHVLCNTA